MIAIFGSSENRKFQGSASGHFRPGSLSTCAYNTLHSPPRLRKQQLPRGIHKKDWFVPCATHPAPLTGALTRAQVRFSGVYRCASSVENPGGSREHRPCALRAHGEGRIHLVRMGLGRAPGANPALRAGHSRGYVAPGARHMVPQTQKILADWGGTSPPRPPSQRRQAKPAPTDGPRNSRGWLRVRTKPRPTPRNTAHRPPCGRRQWPPA